nr:MAG TPA: hypothetical protein [Caudoviricetes sp.]
MSIFHWTGIVFSVRDRTGRRIRPSVARRYPPFVTFWGGGLTTS